MQGVGRLYGGDVSRDAYHHGDLPRAVLGAALEQMATGDRFAVNINRIAKSLGVTHAAVYRHFPTKQAVVDALAKEGFRRLAIAFHETLDGPSPGGTTERIRALAYAYVHFAIAEPILMRVMFSGAAADRQRDPDLKAAAYATIMALQQEVAACADEGLLEPDDVYEVTRFFWAGMHGIATLRIEAQLDGMLTGDDEVDRLVGNSVDWMLAGALRRRPADG